jgi:hypothetical protein
MSSKSMSTVRQVKGDREALEARVYAVVEGAAMEGRRCPTNAEIAANLNASGLRKSVAASSIPGVFRELIRRGLVTVRIYGNNWRDVMILQGPHAGKVTQPPPHGGKPHIVIDKAERERRDKGVTKRREDLPWP